MSNAAKMLVGFGLWPFHAMWAGWIIHLMWQWFVVPLGVSPISVTHAIGLGILVSLLTKDAPQPDDDPDRAFVYITLVAFIRPALALLLAWIIASFGGFS